MNGVGLSKPKSVDNNHNWLILLNFISEMRKIEMSPAQCRFPALVVGNVIPLVGPGKATPANAQIQTALADVVQGRHLLRQAHGMAERHDQHRCPHPDTGRSGGYSGGDDQGGGHDRRNSAPTFWGGKVAFGQPDPVEAPRLGVCCSGEGFLESLFLRLTCPVVTFHHESNVHQRPSSSSPLQQGVSPLPRCPWPRCGARATPPARVLRPGTAYRNWPRQFGGATSRAQHRGTR